MKSFFVFMRKYTCCVHLGIVFLKELTIEEDAGIPFADLRLDFRVFGISIVDGQWWATKTFKLQVHQLSGKMEIYYLNIFHRTYIEFNFIAA